MKSQRRRPRRRHLRDGLAAAIVVFSAIALLLTWRAGPTQQTASPEPIAANKRPPRRFIQTFEARTFLRGDLHAHSAISDGDSPAEMVIAHYRDRGYHFFALTDHNRRLAIERYRSLETDDFVLIEGEEVTMAARGLPVHINALCTKRTIGGARFDDQVAAMRWAVSAILAQDGVALINHPNFHAALDVEHIHAVEGAHLLEIYNGHPSVYSDGRGERGSVESMWDALLARGSTLAPAAVDDMHKLDEHSSRNVPNARPETGWVEVYGAAISRASVCDALRQGRLYASNGPQLSGIAVESRRMRLSLADASMRVAFIGFGGELLDEVTPQPVEGGYRADYALRGDEPFVRARITAADGSRAWTQAYRTRP